ncbi:MAG: hypothetical protein ACI4S2_10515 [Lachnospiraceae bacterium]
MKRKIFFCLLTVEAVVCISFYFLQTYFSNIFSAIVAFPFEQIGWILRKMSLSGVVGNVVAIIIFTFISLTPCGVYFMLRKNGRSCKVDRFLPVISVLLLAVIYYMINPGLFAVSFYGGEKILLGGTFYSVLFGYLVLRILKKFVSADAVQLKKWLRMLGYIVAMLFVYMVFGNRFGVLIDSIKNVNRANSGFLGMSSGLEITYIFLILQFVVDAIPYILDIFIILSAIKVLDELLLDPYSDAAVSASEKLGNLCVKALEITAISAIVFHLLQLIFSGNIRQINVVVSIPVFSMAFVLAALLTVRYVRENQRLKRENDLFI